MSHYDVVIAMFVMVAVFIFAETGNDIVNVLREIRDELRKGK